MEISIILIIFLILAFELVTIAARLFFGSGKRFFSLRKLPHIHNLYFGLAFLIFYNYWYFLELGLALFVQDLIHHSLVLPLWVGESEFF